MVTLADADPGAPSRTAATVSEVCTTARAPMSIARAGSGSIPKVTGRRIATAPVPPRPGMSPMTSPARTPTASMSRSEGSAREARAEKAASVMVASSVDRDVVVVVEQVEHVLADAVVDLVGLADAVGEVEGQQGGEVEAGGRDAAEDQWLVAVDEVLDTLHAGAGAGVDDCSRAVGADRAQVREVVTHGRHVEQVGHDGRRGADQHLGAVGARRGHE